MRSFGVLATASCVILVMACAKGSVGGDGYPGGEGNGAVEGDQPGSGEPGTSEQNPELTGEPIEPPAGEPPAAADAGPPKTDGGATATDSGPQGPACTTTAPSNKCGLLPQCGCAAAETCDVKDTAGNVSCVAAGTATMGRACTSTAGCEKGLTCAFGTCHAFCSSTCSIPGTNTCYQMMQQNNAPVPNFKVCQITCDLRDANSCGGTNAAGAAGCVPDGAGATDCELVGTAQAGQACSGTATAPNCAAGLTCVQLANSSKVCKKWCRVGTSDCGGSTTCTGFSTKIKVGAVEYGVCP